VIDANSRATLPAIFAGNGDPGLALGYAPTGMCVSPDGSRLFVHNFLERSVRVFDIAALTAGTGSSAALLGTVPLLTREPLAANVLQGKKVFHNAQDPRLAHEGYISCASCHLGGDQDGRVWDLGNFGEGLRNTIDLRGHGGMAHGALHWSANFNEVQDFEGQIRSLSGGSGLIVGGAPNPPLGAANAGRSADLDALAAYVSSLTSFLRSPFRQTSGALTTAAANGQVHFANKGCATCHSGTPFTDSSATTLVRHDVGTLSATSGQRLGGTLDSLDTPTLRAVWSTMPYLHRGQAFLLDDIFTTTNAPAGSAHARFRELTAAQQAELVRYLMEIE
jgi:cytochrome c peroxidase